MTELRSAIVKLTGYIVPWTTQEAADLAHASLSRTMAYLASLAKQGVVVLDGPHNWRTGPKARAWRLQPVPKGSTYGNSAEYRHQREILDRIKLRDWQARRAGAKEPTEAQAESQASLATLTCKEVQGEVESGNEEQGMVISPALTLEEACSLLGCCRRTMHTLITTGQIRVYRLGKRAVRITPEAIEEYRKQHTVRL